MTTTKTQRPNAVLTFRINGEEWLAAAEVGPLTHDDGRTMRAEDTLDLAITLVNIKVIVRGGDEPRELVA